MRAIVRRAKHLSLAIKQSAHRKRVPDRYGVADEQNLRERALGWRIHHAVPHVCSLVDVVATIFIFRSKKCLHAVPRTDHAVAVLVSEQRNDSCARFVADFDQAAVFGICQANQLFAVGRKKIAPIMLNVRLATLQPFVQNRQRVHWRSHKRLAPLFDCHFECGDVCRPAA